MDITFIILLSFLIILTILNMALSASIMKDQQELRSVMRIITPVILHADQKATETLAHNRALDSAIPQISGPLAPFSGHDTIRKEIYRTEDGKHSANSLQELLEKIKDDSSYYPKRTNSQDDESSSDFNDLKDLFDLDDDEDWKKGDH